MKLKAAHRLLEGERVFLRTPASSDQAEFRALMQRSRRLYRGLLNPPPARFRDILDRCRRDDFLGFFIFRKEDGALVGAINVFHIVRSGLQSACIGYHIGAPYAGKGYMSDALRVVLRLAFQQLKLHRLEANIQPQNKASQAVVRRAGFKKEGYSRRYLKVCGRWRDHQRWAILREEWTARPSRRRTTR